MNETEEDREREKEIGIMKRHFILIYASIERNNLKNVKHDRYRVIPKTIEMMR